MVNTKSVKQVCLWTLFVPLNLIRTWEGVQYQKFCLNIFWLYHNGYIIMDYYNYIIMVSFKKHLFNVYCMIGTVLDAGWNKMNNGWLITYNWQVAWFLSHYLKGFKYLGMCLRNIYQIKHFQRRGIIKELLKLFEANHWYNIHLVIIV